jgi:hypothetical protein
MSDYDYVGAELKLFADARRWTGYLRRKIAPYLGADVLELARGSARQPPPWRRPHG